MWHQTAPRPPHRVRARSASSSAGGSEVGSDGLPVPLSAHSGGPRTVTAHLEGEVEQLNRDYVFRLKYALGGNQADTHAKLQEIIRQNHV